MKSRFTPLGLTAVQQSFSRKKSADHVSFENVAASHENHEPSLRTFQMLQRWKTHEIRS